MQGEKGMVVGMSLYSQIREAYVSGKSIRSPSFLLRNYCLFRKARFQCTLFHSQYPLLYFQYSLFLHSKVHLFTELNNKIMIS